MIHTFVLALAAWVEPAAGDWPHWRGPQRD